MGLLSNLGRPAEHVRYRHISYESKNYCIGTILSKGEEVKFIIDASDYERVSQYSWHVTANTYISTTIQHDGKRKALYLHNFIMNHDAFKGKGQTHTIDHINRIGYDNRKDNLRYISQSEQNINQKSKERKVILPDGCSITPDDIPRHIWYVKANGKHGDRFAIEFKTEGIVWRTTSSKSVTIEAKLEMAKQRLTDLYILYPYLNPDRINEEYNREKSIYDSIIILIT